MYTVSIPVRSRMIIDNPEQVYEQFERCGATRVFLTTAFSPNPEIVKKRLEALKTNADFFKKKGLEVACWVGASLIGRVIINAVQNSGNSLFGITVYGQQIMACISLLFFAVAIVYGKICIANQKDMKQ